MRRLLVFLAFVLVPTVASAQWVNTPQLTVPIVIPSSAVNGAGYAPALSTGQLIVIGPGTGVTMVNGSTSVLTLTGSLTSTGNLTSGLDVQLAATGFLHWAGRGGFDTGANGNYRLQIEAGTIGSLFKVDALPVASVCGAGSPAVVAGSTPLSGAVTVGTGGPLTCTITFGGTAYPQIPHCSGAVETTTAANARAMGYSASTTVLTIVPSAAWADSSVVNWNCMSPKS